MMRRACMCGVVAAAAIGAATGKEFTLTFKTVPAKEVMAFPGGYGASASMRPGRPAAIRKEPAAVSRHPLYLEWRLTGGGVFAGRLDESKGDAKGYDRLIVDINRNGDLTDDPVVQRVALPTDRKATSGPEQMLFGPIEAPNDRQIAGGSPVYFVQVYFYQIPSSALSTRAVRLPSGSARLKAGWYLEAMVEMDGLKRKVGIYDGDGNLHLGDLAKPQILRSGGQDSSWYFRPGDSWLVDANGSGAFENDALQSESCPFGPVLYLDAKPYNAALTSDCKSLRLDPWTDALATVALEPQGEQVCGVTLAWERSGGQWQLLKAGTEGGKIQVPPGNYRLYVCDLLGNRAASDQVMASATQRSLLKPFSFVAGKANTLRCGAPLEIKVTASKTGAGSRLLELFDGSDGALGTSSSLMVRINANVTGAGGETYSTYAKGEKLGERPPRPTFTIADASGKEVMNGNLEFG